MFNTGKIPNADFIKVQVLCAWSLKYINIFDKYTDLMLHVH